MQNMKLTPSDVQEMSQQISDQLSVVKCMHKMKLTHVRTTKSVMCIAEGVLATPPSSKASLGILK